MSVTQKVFGSATANRRSTISFAPAGPALRFRTRLSAKISGIPTAVLFDWICGESDIEDLFTTPRSPATTGKYVRDYADWHQFAGDQSGGSSRSNLSGHQTGAQLIYQVCGHRHGDAVPGGSSDDGSSYRLELDRPAGSVVALHRGLHRCRDPV
jgi:hypothetical protein